MPEIPERVSSASLVLVLASVGLQQQQPQQSLRTRKFASCTAHLKPEVLCGVRESSSLEEAPDA